MKSDSLLMTAMILLLSFTSKAQTSLGVTAGASFANLKISSGGFSASPKMKMDLTTGLKEDLYKKSKKQGTTAWILAGGGLVLEVAGVLTYQSGNASLFLLGAGLLSQVISLPFFISAAITEHKAKKASLSFKLQKTPVILPSATSFRSGLQLSLKVPL
jgi:hypothetical protein